MKVWLIFAIQRNSQINNGWEQGFFFCFCDNFTLPFLVLMEYAIMSNEVGKTIKTCKYLDHWKNPHFLSLVHLILGM
jgi:hypothetical protein